ncbi:MAG TPA: ATP-dependent metallopeptidase FtsH/Yme1/Tma family protein, partial [Natronosporangium sp.]|nr:ATP-dependent metallopeptidase FtsH/Yme1/Tma family protein [Natronosporangium sp.]
MERTRFFRRPVFWFLLVAFGAIALIYYFTSRDSYTDVETSVALERLGQGNIESVLIEDREQVIKIDLAEPMTVDGRETTQIQANYMANIGAQLWDQVQTAQQEGRITGTVDTEVTQESVWTSMLVMLLPVALIVILLLLFMSQMQGGGSRVL